MINNCTFWHFTFLKMKKNRCTLESGAQLVPLNLELFHIIRKVVNLEDSDDIRAFSLENETICDGHGEAHANLKSFHFFSKDRNATSANDVSFAYFGQCLVIFLKQ